MGQRGGDAARSGTRGAQVVGIASYGRKGASARVRMYEWFDHFGLDADTYSYADLASNSARQLLKHPFSAFRAEIGLRSLVRRVDRRKLGVFLSKQASPFSTGDLESALLDAAGRGVYDFDDAIWLDDRSGVYKSFSKARIWARSVASADVIIAGNEMLASKAREEAGSRADIRVIPSCVEPTHYRVKEDYALAGPPTAVWMGSPSTEMYLLTIAGALIEAHRRLDLRLRLVSSGNRSLGDLDHMIERVQWTPDVSQELADADFGLMPLENTPYAQGKCAYKLLQYGAAGLPAVGSPVGANVAAMEGLGQVPAASMSDWFSTIRELVSMSSKEREQCGSAGRAGVVRLYSFSAWADAWSDAAL